MISETIYICPNYNEYKFKSERVWRTDGKYEPFVYIIEEIETGMKYIGSRTAKNCLHSDLGNTYFTSSRYIDWSESNINNFIILEILPCASNHDAQILEEILIKDKDALFNENYYNKGHPYIGFHGSINRGRKQTKETRKNRSKALKKARKNNKKWYKEEGTQFEISSKGGKITGKKNAENGHLIKIANDYWDKVRSGELIRKKKCFIHNKTTLENKMIPLNEPIPHGWAKGRATNPNKEKTYWVYNPETLRNKRVPINEEVPNGWIKGKYSNNKNFIYIYNIETLEIKRFVGNKIPDGWKRGRKPK